MTALFFIAAAIAAYFFLKMFDTKKEENTQHIAPIKPINLNNPNAKVQELKFFCVMDKGYHVSVWPRDRSQFDIVEFNIAGITHYKEVAMKHLGETMGFLVEEPDNPYDANAIKIVTSEWECVGCVPRDMTDNIRENTKLPCPCLFYIGYHTEDDGIHFYTDAYIDLNYTNK